MIGELLALEDPPALMETMRDFATENIGKPRDVEQGGGTYGFGKSSFYLMSDRSCSLSTLPQKTAIERSAGFWLTRQKA